MSSGVDTVLKFLKIIIDTYLDCAAIKSYFLHNEVVQFRKIIICEFPNVAARCLDEFI
ncbi:MAG: hypothetical protein FFODKBPE_00607 [Candidatus Argoarchaeum ethanivorans]|uniref:Uncharacterized protein n=1 Tax=Candidatus Argoarchaeum ethanivorans TaxID=2608793 RepID=A0A811TE79_9EURY|nr:MAG: hypothetical protein FFODKBPE_00607 [Candidatus Argoarchaeum ethanivorans]